MDVLDPAIFSTAVSVIVPVWNEAIYIESCLDSLLRQVGCNVVEIIVVDGGSTDQTIPLITSFSERHPQVRLMHNPRRLQSAAVNLATRAIDPRSEIFVRADAHMTYEADFVMRCVQALLKNNATSVVVSMTTVGRTGFQRAVAAVQNSLLGTGGAAHRSGEQRSRFVEHGHHAAFDLAFFRKCAGYDESFRINEDIEFDLRCRNAGARIWMASEARVYYFPRRTLSALARQYFGYGLWRVRTLTRHRVLPKLRQMLPVLLLALVVLGTALSLFWWEAALPPLFYGLFCLAFGAAIAVRRRDPWLSAAGPALLVMHLSYGVGVVCGVIDKAVNPGRAIRLGGSCTCKLSG